MTSLTSIPLAYIAIPVSQTGGNNKSLLRQYDDNTDEFDASSIIDDSEPGDQGIQRCGNSKNNNSNSRSEGARRPFFVSETQLKTLQRQALFLGTMIGFLVECGALTIHMFIHENDGTGQRLADATMKSSISSSNSWQIMLFSFTWALFASILPCLVLFSIKFILFATHEMMTMMMKSSGNYDYVCIVNERRYWQALMWHLECRFGMGSFLGVSISVAIVDTFLGLTVHLITNLVLFMILSAGFVVVQGSRREELLLEVLECGEDCDCCCCGGGGNGGNHDRGKNYFSDSGLREKTNRMHDLTPLYM